MEAKKKNSEYFDQPKAALIIVDLIEDFAEGGSLAVKGAREIATRVNEIMDGFSTIIAVNDSHPADHCSFKTWPAHCVKGSHGANFIKELNSKNINKIFPKGTDSSVDSYSGFLDNDGKTETGLREFLELNEINMIFVVGVATDYCVKATALDAVKYGFTTFVFIDLIAPVNIHPNDEQQALEEMFDAGVRPLKATDFMVEYLRSHRMK